MESGKSYFHQVHIEQLKWEFRSAILNDDDLTCQKIMEAGRKEFDINQSLTNQTNDLPLRIAIEKASLDVIKVILQNKQLDVMQTFYGESYLFYAIREAINKGVTIRTGITKQQTIVKREIELKYLEIIKSLIIKNPLILCIKFYDNETPIEYLRNAGSNYFPTILGELEAQGDRLKRLLYQAMIDNHTADYELILDSKLVNLNLPLTKQKESLPLCVAIDTGNLKLVERIIADASFNIKKADLIHKPYLYYVLDSEKISLPIKLAILKMLITKEPALLHQNYSKLTPYEYAQKINADPSVLEYLQFEPATSPIEDAGEMNAKSTGENKIPSPSSMARTENLFSSLSFGAQLNRVYIEYAKDLDTLKSEASPQVRNFLSKVSIHLKKVIDYGEDIVNKKNIRLSQDDLQSLREISIKPDSRLIKTIRRYDLIFVLLQYRDRRKKEVTHPDLSKDYTGIFGRLSVYLNKGQTFFGRLTGYSAQEKLDLIDKLVDHLLNSKKPLTLNDKEVKILEDGRLGRYIKPYQDIIEDFKIAPTHQTLHIKE